MSDDPNMVYLTMRERHLLCQAITVAMESFAVEEPIQEMEFRAIRRRLAAIDEPQPEKNSLQ